MEYEVDLNCRVLVLIIIRKVAGGFRVRFIVRRIFRIFSTFINRKVFRNAAKLGKFAGSALVCMLCGHCLRKTVLCDLFGNRLIFNDCHHV